MESPAFANTSRVMSRFAIYPPPQRALPWLLVALDGDRPADMFACEDLEAAERLLREMRARQEGKDGSGDLHTASASALA
jgi:hypothetical protein